MLKRRKNISNKTSIFVNDKEVLVDKNGFINIQIKVEIQQPTT